MQAMEASWDLSSSSLSSSTSSASSSSSSFSSSLSSSSSSFLCYIVSGISDVEVPETPRSPRLAKTSLAGGNTPFVKLFSGADARGHFLNRCFLCKKPISGEEDIFMYKGDVPFCSEDCRREQIDMDEALEDNRIIAKLFQRHFGEPIDHHQKAQAIVELCS